MSKPIPEDRSEIKVVPDAVREVWLTEEQRKQPGIPDWSKAAEDPKPIGASVAVGGRRYVALVGWPLLSRTKRGIVRDAESRVEVFHCTHLHRNRRTALECAERAIREMTVAV